MQEKSTANVFWFFATVISFFLGGPILAFIAAICWICAAGRTRKHNAAVRDRRHLEMMIATAAGGRR